MSATIYYWNGLIINSEISAKYKSSIEKLISGQFQSADLDLKKMRGYRLYSVRANDADRLLFTTIKVGGKPYLLFIEEIEGHAYNKSRFLNNPVTLARFLERECNDLVDLINTDEAFETIDANSYELAELDYHHVDDLTPVPMDYYKQQLIVLNDVQQEALLVRAPAIIMGPPGSGKSCIASLLIANADSTFEKIVYVTSNRRLVKDIEASWLAMPDSSKSALGRVRFMTYLDLIYENDPEAKKRKLTGLDEFCSWFKRYIQAQERLLKTKNKNAKRSKQSRRQEDKNSIPEKLLDAQLIYQEFRIASGYESEGYIKAQFKSNYKGDSQRQWIFSAYQSYCHYLAEENLLDPSFYVLRFSNQPDRLIIDEGQDFSNRQLKQLIDWQFMFYICMDSHQRLFDCQTSSPFIQQYIYHARAINTQYVMLPYSYRVFSAAQPLIAEMLAIRLKLIGGQADKHEFIQLPITLENNSAPGSVYWFEDLSDSVLKTLKQAGASQHFAVVTTRDRVEYAKQYFNTQLVFTVDEIKGLEYPVVVLFELFDDAMFIKANNLLRNPEQANLASSSTSHRAAEGVGDPTLGPICNQAFTAMTRASSQLIVCNKRRHNIGLLFDRLKAKVPASNHFEIELICTPASDAEWMEEVMRQIDWNNLDIARQIFFRRLNKTEKEFQCLLTPEPSSVALPVCSSQQAESLPAPKSFQQKKRPEKKTRPARLVQQVNTKQSLTPMRSDAGTQALAAVATDKKQQTDHDPIRMLYSQILTMGISLSDLECMVGQCANIGMLSLATLCQQNSIAGLGHTSILSLLCTPYDEVKHKMLGVLLRDPLLLNALCEKLKALLDCNQDVLSDELYFDLGDMANLYSTSSGLVLLGQIICTGGFIHENFFTQLFSFKHPYRADLTTLDDMHFETNPKYTPQQVLVIQEFISRIVRGSRQQQIATINDFRDRMDTQTLLYFSRVLFARSTPGLLMTVKHKSITTVELLQLAKDFFHLHHDNEPGLFDRVFDFINENPHAGVAKYQLFFESLMKDETLNLMSEQTGFFSVINHQVQSDYHLVQKLNKLSSHFWIGQVKQHISGIHIDRQNNIVKVLQYHNARGNLLLKSCIVLNKEDSPSAEVLLVVLKRFRLQIPRRERELHRFVNGMTLNIIKLLGKGHRALYSYIGQTLEHEEIAWDSALAGLLRETRDQLSDRIFGEAVLQSKVKEGKKIPAIANQPKKPMDAIKTSEDVLNHLLSQEDYPPDFVFYCLSLRFGPEGSNVLMFVARYYPEYIKPLLNRLASLSDTQKSKILCLTSNDGYNLFLVAAKYYFHSHYDLIFDQLKQLKPEQIVGVLSQQTEDGVSILTRIGILSLSQVNALLDMFERLSNQELELIIKSHCINHANANGLLNLVSFNYNETILIRLLEIIARLDLDVQKDIICYRNNSGQTLLSLACQLKPDLVEPVINSIKRLGREELLVTMLLHHTNEQYTPLFIAIICQPDLVGSLLEVIHGLTHDVDKSRILLNRNRSENALLMIAQLAVDHVDLVLTLINQLSNKERFVCLSHFIEQANEKGIALNELLSPNIVANLFDSPDFNVLLEENRRYIVIDEEQTTSDGKPTALSWVINDELTLEPGEETFAEMIYSLLQKDIQTPGQIEAYIYNNPILLSWITLDKLLNQNGSEQRNGQDSLLRCLCAPYDQASHRLLEKILQNKSLRMALANTMAINVRDQSIASLNLYDLSGLMTTPLGMQILFVLEQTYKGHTNGFFKTLEYAYDSRTRASSLVCDEQTILLDKIAALQRLAKEFHLNSVDHWKELYVKALEHLPRSMLNPLMRNLYMKNQLAKVIYTKTESPFDLISIVNTIKQFGLELTEHDLILCDKLCNFYQKGLNSGEIAVIARESFISNLYHCPDLDVTGMMAAVLRYELLLMEQEKSCWETINTSDFLITLNVMQIKSSHKVNILRLAFLAEKLEQANQFGLEVYSTYEKASNHCNLRANKRRAFGIAMILYCSQYLADKYIDSPHFKQPMPIDMLLIELINNYSYSLEDCIAFLNRAIRNTTLEPLSSLAGILRSIREMLVKSINSKQPGVVGGTPVTSSPSFFNSRGQVQPVLKTARDVINNISSLRHLTPKQLALKLGLTDEKGRNVLLICAFEQRTGELIQLLNLLKRIPEKQRHNVLTHVDFFNIDLLSYCMMLGLPMVQRLIGILKEFGSDRWRAMLVKTYKKITDFIHASPGTLAFIINTIKELPLADRNEIFSESAMVNAKALNIFFSARSPVAFDLLSIIMTLSDELRTTLIAPFPAPKPQYSKRLLVVVAVFYPALIVPLMSAIKQLDTPDILEKQLTFLDFEGNLLAQALHYRSTAVPKLIEEISQLKSESILEILTAIYSNGEGNTLIKAILYAPDYLPQLIELAAQLDESSREQLIQQTRQLLDGRVGTAAIEAQVLEMLGAIESKSYCLCIDS